MRLKAVIDETPLNTCENMNNTLKALPSSSVPSIYYVDGIKGVGKSSNVMLTLVYRGNQEVQIMFLGQLTGWFTFQSFSKSVCVKIVKQLLLTEADGSCLTKVTSGDNRG